MNRVSHSRGKQTDTVQSVWAGGKAACTPSCRFRHTLALHVKESCLKETDFLWLTACSMRLPQPCPSFTPADWEVREAYPGLENRLSLIPAACQDSSKPQLPFLGKKWEEARNHIPEGTFTSTRGNKKAWNSQKDSPPGYFGSPETERLEFRKRMRSRYDSLPPCPSHRQVVPFSFQ